MNKISAPSATRRSLRYLLVAFLVLLGCVQAQGSNEATQGDAEDATATDLPITRVILFTSGIGYFEHAGTVEGNVQIELSVPGEDMDDLLQSLVLQDFDGGTIRPVRYASRDPLSRILAGYSLDLSADPTLAALLSQARGERITIETSERMSGTIVTVEQHTVPEQETLTYMTLSTATGLKRIELGEVRSIRFVRDELQSELEEALAAVARYRGDEDKPVRLSFEGDGQRRVSVGYIREMPVWKTSYRLLLGDEGEAELQGWAIFDNPTDLDLENVSVSFVAGQPISFLSDLYEPIYIERRRIEANTASGVSARAFAADSVAEAEERAQQEFAAAARLAPPAATPQLSGAGLSAMAQGAQTGATFEYRVNGPVTIGRHESAMIPIVSGPVEAHRLSIYDPQGHAVHPLRGVRLQNDTRLHLAAGPISVFDEGGFTGNALISDIVPDDSRVLAFAADLELEVTTASDSRPEEVVAVAIQNGLVETSQRQRITTRYDIEASGSEPRFLVIEHPRRDGFEVTAPETTPATTPQSYRFGVAIGAAAPASTPSTDTTVPTQLQCELGPPCRLTVVMERTQTRSLTVTNLSSDQIVFYLQNVALAEEDRATFSRVLELKQRLTELDRQVTAQRSQVDSIHQDQARIRQNMGQLDRNSSLYRRYLADLEAQENELGSLSDTIDGLQEQRREVQEQLASLIRSLAT
ncbi:MAG: hypothetical protein WD273_13950 [Trueperaceae bacterium]